MHPVDLTVLLLYVGLLIVLGLFVRPAKTVEDFSVASRELPSPILFATLAATYVGPGYSIGLADKASANGYVWFFVFSMFCLQTLLVGRFIAPRLQAFHSARTIGGVLRCSFGRLTQFVAGILTIAVLTGFIGVMAKASGSLISDITGVSSLWGVAVSTTVVLIYSTFGGIKADITNDVFQFILLSIAVPLLLILGLYHDGIDTLQAGVARLPLIPAAFPPLALLGLALSFFLGEMLIPPYAIRALAARSPKDARRGFTIAAIFGVAWFFVCTTIGVLHASSGHDSSSGAITTAMRAYLPPGFFGILLAALVAIILSSWDSLLNCASSAFNADIIDVLIPRTQRRYPAIVASRILNVVIGIGASVFALTVPGLVEALLYCYTLWAPTIVLPLIYAALRVRVHPLSGLTAIIAGGVAAAVWEWGLKQPAGIPSVIVGLVANQLAFWATHLLYSGRPAPSWLLHSPSEG